MMSGMNLGPWDYGDEALRIFRFYSVLHMSLFPYRYAAAQESARTGMPMVRALVLADQEDAEARDAAGEYLLGPDLLVAPVLSPVTQRAVYLPAGNWIDYWTGRCFNGKQTIVAEAPINRIPVFVREGSILPKIPEDVMTLVAQSQIKSPGIHALDDRRVYEIWPGNDARTLADFEGRSLAYEPKTGSLRIAGAPARITLRWKFAHPAAVSVNGHKLDAVSTAADGASADFAHSGSSTITWLSR